MEKINNNSLFSIIIPTMWESNKIFNLLQKYEKSNYVGEIIVIDNQPTKKPNLENYKKIVYQTKGENIFVNPAWNLGYSIAKYKIILSNDDIIINDLDVILENILKSDFDIIGLGENKTQHLKIDEIKNFPRQSYGSFIYVRNYFYIPEQLKIWCGDDFLFTLNKKRGILKNSGIHSNTSQTVRIIQKTNNSILEDDKKEYDKLFQTKKLNIVIRTSNRPNFFKYCIDSVRKYYPSAKIHITIDNEIDLDYVKNNTSDLDYCYYKVNPKTIKNIVDKIKIPESRRRFDSNYYFNVVKPLLNGWVMYLDDDDILTNTFDFDLNNLSKIFLFKTNINEKTIPSEKSFNRSPVLNDINTKCILVHSQNIVDWKPNKGGDFDFINEIYNKNKSNVVWVNKILSSTQLGENMGKKNDRELVTSGYYLNLKKRVDRRIKMDNQLKKIKCSIDRFEAIDGDNLKSVDNFYGSIKGSEKKQYATYLSHLNLLKNSLNLKTNYVIVLEDDVTLCDDFDQRLEFFIKTMPTDWVIGYLGYNEQDDTEKVKITENIFRIKNVFGCFGMIIKKDFIPKLINIVERKKIAIDEVIKTEVQKTYPCYAFIPFFLYVNDDYSDIWLKNRTLGKIKKYFKDEIEHNEPKKIPEKKKIDLGVILNKQPRKIVENKIIKPEKKQISPDITHLLTPKENIIPQPKKKSYYTDVNPMKTQQEEIRQMLIDKKKNTSLSDLAKEMKNTKRIK
jgi:GR25 family glycosyltransferase involved in LPS biosynthesis